VIDISAIPAQPLAGSDISDGQRGVATRGHKLDNAWLFTWERPEHASCEHKLGPVTAIKADGTKLGLCQYCNLVGLLKPGSREAQWGQSQ
jgi:hypothetical protein